VEPAKVIPIAIELSGSRAVYSYLVFAERPFLIDTGIPGSAPQILDVLSHEGVDPRDLAFILITHGHTDHTGSLPELKQASGAPVVVQRKDAPFVAEGTSAPVRGRTPEERRMVDAMATQRRIRQEHMRGVEPDVVVDDEMDLGPLGVKGRALRTPGHTEGGLTVLLDSGEAFVGDLIAADYRDPHVPGPGMFAVDVDEMDESIARVVALEPRVVHTGHAGSFTIEQLRRAFGQ
jgi:glyoxylase-like metal-dependent hydrolase (beta-lactamase superfamily II)